MNLSFSTLSSFLAAAIFSPNVHVVDSQQIEIFSGYPCNLFLGEIQCWGDGYPPNPASGTPTFTNMPDSESGLPIKLADTYPATLALLDNGKVYGWRTNHNGLLGVSVSSGDTITDPAIVQLNDENGDPQDISDVVDIKGGGYHACAKHDDKSITCWGNDCFTNIINGQIDCGLNTGPTNEYDGTSESKKANLFDTGTLSTCVVSMDGFMKCYGLLQEIEYNATTTGNNILDIQLSGDQVCIMTDAVGSNLLCAGRNHAGQLGNGATTSYPEINSFVSPNNGLGNVNSFTLGSSHTCAIQSNDSIMKCWGSNYDSQLGVASDEGNVLTPTEVVVMDGINIGTATILGMQAGASNTYLLLSDNKVFSWGQNYNGLLGIGNTNSSIVAKGQGGAREVLLQIMSTSSPTSIPSSTPSTSTTTSSPTGSIYDIGPQSQYKWTTSYPDTPTFDWNITITDFMSIDKPTTEQGIYNLRSKYILDDRSFDVELFKVDCVNAPSGIDNFPLVFFDGTVVPDHTDPNVKEIDVELEWTYNQTKIESSDLWTANKTGGYSEFCIKVSNYLKENDHDFGREIHFLEVKYRIEVDSLTDFNETITLDRIDATDGGVEEINYEEEITVFQCRDTYEEITNPVPLTQGDFLQLCVTTKGESKFGVHSIKELDVSQQDDTPSLYPYVDGFVDSPLAESACKAEVKNTSAAVCKTKMQLLSAYFDLTELASDPAALFANGTVKLDYVGRRLSVDVPLNLRYDDNNGALKGAAVAAVDVAAAGRVLAEEDGGPSFGLEVGLSGGDGGQSDASTSALSMGGLFSAGMAFLAGAGML